MNRLRALPDRKLCGLIVSLCAATGLLADEYDNTWPAKKEYENPAVTRAMEAVREATAQAAKDPARPVYHFRPAARWMNGPCGAIYHKGYYHVFLDRSVMEVYVNGGRECITRVIYPGADDLGIEVFAEGGTAKLESMDVWEMKSIW